MMTTQQNDREVYVTDREIDQLMAEYGYGWHESDREYVNGDLVVSGDFASEMCKRLKASQQAIDKTVTEARIEENESIRYMLAETIELGRDWCYNHDKYIPQCYACQTAKWTKIIAKMYLHSIKERLARLHEQKKSTPGK